MLNSGPVPALKTFKNGDNATITFHEDFYLSFLRKNKCVYLCAENFCTKSRNGSAEAVHPLKKMAEHSGSEELKLCILVCAMMLSEITGAGRSGCTSPK